MEKKELKKLEILRSLLESEKSIAGLCEHINISTPTCLNFVSALLEEGAIMKSGQGQSIGGRKPDLYALMPGKYFVLAIELERYQTRMTILDNSYRYSIPVKTFHLNIATEADPVSQLHNMASALISEAGIDKESLIGIGISMPGLVDSKRGENYTFIISTNQLRSLQQELEDTFSKPVFIQNDVKCYAIAEKRFGLAREKRDVMVLLMDWGIGLGIIMDGELRGGTAGFSGEIGHIPLIDDGILCYCGKRGCLETVASGVALAKMAKEGILSGQDSLLNRISNSEIDKIEPHVVIDAANLGDQYAINILADVGAKMGKGIATVIQLFNPELIILGGKMAKARQYITIPMQQAINTYCMTQIREKASIQVSELGTDASILGVTSMVLENYFDQQIEMATPGKQKKK
ncbi:putative NBD/HSP70 family sugar kinase [Pseudobacter ginsenosidimutans]|uniref:Putative NBD/HSP70 family sugar kinase n=1 Tax=Pseudobacter ginsenosidimutans TaxID=661488 RepID=A0A4Q7N451_9BACT|nr:ROK family transcriptional regulator [Pseudobacter ginsenosidimutans]RZS75772.1 putative NBD/HSP70 family sugar kinase [Pseudobacter ginsenosidimutans]